MRKRRQLSRSGSQKYFTNTAAPHRKNSSNRTIPRGGIRL